MNMFLYHAIPFARSLPPAKWDNLCFFKLSFVTPVCMKETKVIESSRDVILHQFLIIQHLFRKNAQRTGDEQK